MGIQLHSSRRGLLASASAGGLLVAIGLPPAGQGARAAGSPVTLGAFLRIGADGAVTVVAPCVEMGQGSHTAHAMIVADELGADWGRVSVQPAPLDPAYRTPGRPMQNTSGSQMVRRWNAPLRKSAAAAREMLTSAAASRWGIPAGECRAVNGAIVHEPSRRSLAFGDVVLDAARLPEPRDPTLRTDGTIVGTSPRRLDLGGKVDGSAVFGIDVRIPGMTYAAIRQAPVFGTTLDSVATNSVEGRPGILKVVRLPSAVAVVATTFWAAKNAVDALDPVFSRAPQPLSSDDIFRAQRIHLDSPVASAGIATGDAPGALARAVRTVTGDYAVGFLHHATMEPMVCTVSINPDRCEYWVPTQNLTGVGDVGARITGLPLSKIVVNATLLGGGFGRKFEQDFVEQATLIAKDVGRPVQLIWTREEDTQHGFYRPAMTARLTTALGPDGTVTGLRMRIAGPSVIEHTVGTPFVRGVDPVAFAGIATETPHAPHRIQQYSIPDFLADYVYAPSPVPIGYWRAVGATENGFFIETHLDEVAVTLGQDPMAFRRHLMRESPRGIAVLDAVAERSAWGTQLPEGRHRGVAFSEAVGSLVAQVVEISMVDGAPKVHRVVCAIDCGRAVHPDNVRAQVEGSIIMGLSAALTEEITIADGRAEQHNFSDYVIHRLTDAPAIEVHVIGSGAALGGVGEAAVPAVAPALCNAVFAATRHRIRQLPIARSLPIRA